MSSTLTYRPEIDGLRALAVLPVIFFHAGFEHFSGGYIGVDVFFVISGFLITSILLNEINNNKFSLISFYERRARRILPALAVVVFVTMPFSWMYLNTSQFQDYSQSVTAVSLFGSNILFWLESGYFQAASEEKPLLHTWSLAVEEQFYLFFPILLLLLYRRSRGGLYTWLFLISMISFILCEYLVVSKPSANFFLLPSRIWELFVGAFAAILMKSVDPKANDILSMVGLSFIVSGIFLFDEYTPFPSAYTLAPVIGTFLVILFGRNNTLVNKILSNSLLVSIGLLSYSAYLWHQPIFAFVRVNSIEELDLNLKWIMVLSSLLIAFISWKFIESPFRNKRHFTRARIFKLSIFTLLLFFLIGNLGSWFANVVNPGQFNEAMFFKLSKNSIGNEKLRLESWIKLKEKNEHSLWYDLDKNMEKVLILGNSHSKDIYNTLTFSKTNGEDFQFSRYGIQISEVPHNISKIRRLPNYKFADTVVFASRYDLADIEEFEKVISLFIEDNKRLVIILNTFEFPEYRTRKWTMAEYVAYKHSVDDKLLNLVSPSDLADIINQQYFIAYTEKKYASRHDFNGNVHDINQRLIALARNHPEIKILDRMEYQCEIKSEVCFAVSKDLEKYYYDYGHNSIAGARFFATRIDELNWFVKPNEKNKKSKENSYY